MTTLDSFAPRPALRFKWQGAAMAASVLLLLALGAVALTAPPTDAPREWHGNVAVSPVR